MPDWKYTLSDTNLVGSFVKGTPIFHIFWYLIESDYEKQAFKTTIKFREVWKAILFHIFANLVTLIVIEWID